MATQADNEQSIESSFLTGGQEIDYTDESSDSESDPGTGGAPQGKQEDDEQDFSGYVDTPEN